MLKEKIKNLVSKEKLLEAGAYFGHHTSMWNPKMKPFIHMKRRKIHIIDLQKTRLALTFAYQLLKKYTEKKASFIFVGTRKCAKDTIKYNALRTNSFYVSERWLGGTLTNLGTIQKRVHTLNDLEKKAANNYEGYTKKEGVMFSKELAKLQRNLTGIRNMKFKPHVMIIADPMHDIIAVKEAKKIGMKIIGITDTNTDPTLVDVAIPANDDSVKSVTLIITLLADAIVEQKDGIIEYAFKTDEEIVLPIDPNKNDQEKTNNYNKFNNYRTQKSYSDQSNKKVVKSLEKKEPINNNDLLNTHTKKELIAIIELKKIKYKVSMTKNELIELIKSTK